MNFRAFVIGNIRLRIKRIFRDAIGQMLAANVREDTGRQTPPMFQNSHSRHMPSKMAATPKSRRRVEMDQVAEFW